MTKIKNQLIIEKIIEESSFILNKYRKLMSKQINEKNCVCIYNNYLSFISLEDEFNCKIKKNNINQESIIMLVVDMLTLIEKISEKIVINKLNINREIRILHLKVEKFKKTFFSLVELFFTKSKITNEELIKCLN